MKLQSTVTGLVLALTALPASAQLVRYEFSDRMTDRKTVQVLLPSASGQDYLSFRCGFVALISPAFAGAKGGATLTWRADQQPPVDMNVQVQADVSAAVIEQGRRGKLSEAARTAASIGMRIGGPGGRVDLEFPLSHDTREAFAIAAEAAGVSRVAARMGYDHLASAITRAVARQDAGFASLMQHVGIPLRQNNRTREAWEILPNVLKALNANKARPVVEDMGQTIFGYAWQELKPLLAFDGERYRTLNGMAAQQLDWLDKACGD